MTAPAPMSFATWRCRSCGHYENEPHALTEPELRRALEAGEVPCIRLHADCPRGVVAVEAVVAVRPTLFAVLGSFGAEP